LYSNKLGYNSFYRIILGGLLAPFWVGGLNNLFRIKLRNLNSKIGLGLRKLEFLGNFKVVIKFIKAKTKIGVP